MIHVEPKNLAAGEAYRYLIGGVAPRPIALVSTISTDGKVNLAPYSFFNAFSANPPLVVFSPTRRGQDATQKDTYHNLIATRECTIQAVTYDMVQQVNVTSGDYPPEVDEFAKSGLTPVASDLVRPPLVGESPFQLECVMKQMIELGETRGAGNLALCEVVKFHISEEIMVDGVIDPRRLDLVGRNSGNWYTRAAGDALFEVRRPAGPPGMGYDSLPDCIKNSDILSANDIAQLALAERLPTPAEAAERIGLIKNGEPSVAAFDKACQAGKYGEALQMAIAMQHEGNAQWKEFFFLAARCALVQHDIDLALNALVYATTVK